MGRTTNIIAIPNISIYQCDFEKFLEECAHDYALDHSINMLGLQKNLKEQGVDVGLELSEDYGFRKVDEMAGGNRGFEANIYMVAYKNFNMHDFIAKTEAWVKLQSPRASVQLFIQDEDDVVFSFYTCENRENG